MKSSTHPIIYHPSNILLLDDDRKFMNLVASQLDEYSPFVMRDNPREALEYLSSHVFYPSELVNLVAQQTFDFHRDEKASFNNDTFTIDLGALKGDLSSANRFKKVFVAVVDRRMPAMDGLDFCKILREDMRLPVKLILLTGATSTDEAVDAFNAGTIDAYIEKRSNEEMITQLNETIQKLVWQQLSEISQSLVGLLQPQLSHVFDAKFYERFAEIRQEHNIVEFYLLDSSGSFVMLNSDGRMKMLLVRTNEDFEGMYDLAKDSGALQNVLQDLRDRQKFPFTSSGLGHLSLTGDRWDAVMVDMHKIPGRELFYSVVDIANGDVLGFDKYQGEIWPEP